MYNPKFDVSEKEKFMLRPGESYFDLPETIEIEYFNRIKVKYSQIKIGSYSHNNSKNSSYVLWPDDNSPENELPLSIYIVDFGMTDVAAIDTTNRQIKDAIGQLVDLGCATQIGYGIKSGYVEYPLYHFSI